MWNKFKTKISDFIDDLILHIVVLTSNIRRWDKWANEINKIKDLDAKVNVTKSILENQQKVNRYLFIGKEVNNG